MLHPICLLIIGKVAMRTGPKSALRKVCAGRAQRCETRLADDWRRGPRWEVVLSGRFPWRIGKACRAWPSATSPGVRMGLPPGSARSFRRYRSGAGSARRRCRSGRTRAATVRAWVICCLAASFDDAGSAAAAARSWSRDTRKHRCRSSSSPSSARRLDVKWDAAGRRTASIGVLMARLLDGAMTFGFARPALGDGRRQGGRLSHRSCLGIPWCLSDRFANRAEVGHA